MIARMTLAFLLLPVVALGQARDCISRPINPVAVHASLKGVYEKLGKRLRIDPDLAQAITQIESGFDPRAVSPKGAQGLMQLMPDTSAAMHVANPLDPHQSILGGMQFLRVLANDPRFAGNPYMVLVAYNAGPNRAVFPEESYRYADAVLSVYQKLKAQNVRRGGLIEPTQTLDRSFLGAIQCGQTSPAAPRVAVAGGKVQPSRHYR
jgi:soluble lytic murein transglycosylase-like protein